MASLDSVNRSFITRAKSYKNAVLEIYPISDELRQNIEAFFQEYLTQNKSIKSIEDKKSYLKKWLNDLAELIQQPNLSLIEQLYLWQCGRKSLTTSQEKAGYSIIYREIPKANLTEELCEEFTYIHKKIPPIWFQNLPLFAQQYLKKRFPRNYSFNKKDLAGIPCLLKAIPGLANFSRHEMIIMNQEKEIIFKSSLLRSASIVPNHIMQYSERKRITQLNLQQLLVDIPSNYYHGDKVPILMETVLSPAWYQFFLPYKPNNNLSFYQMKNDSIQLQQEKFPQIKLIAVNYVVNRLPNNFKLAVMRFFSLFMRQSAQKVALELINTLLEKKEERNYFALSNLYFALKKNKKKLALYLIDNLLQKKPDLVLTALSEYIYIVFDLKKLPKLPYQRNKELYAAALVLIINNQLGGLTHITCKSGKDRSGITILWFDTMLEYYYLYKKIPSYFDEAADYKKFIRLFAENLLSFHQQKNANQNAPGCLGLKISKGFFSDEVLNILTKEAEEIGLADMLIKNQLLASLNKII